MIQYKIYLALTLTTIIFLVVSDWDNKREVIADNLFRSPENYDNDYIELFIYGFAWPILWPLGLTVLGLTYYKELDV